MSSPLSPSGVPEPQAAHLFEYVYIVLRRQKLVAAVFLAVVAASAVRSFMTRPVYQASAQILIERSTPNVLPFKEGSAENDWQGDEFYQTQYKLLQSRALARRVVDGLNLLQDPEFGGPRSPETVEEAKTAPPGTSPLMEGAIGGYLGRLRVQPIRNSRLVSVGFEAFRPDLASRAANKHAELYIAQTLEFRYRTSSEAGEWLGGQVTEQRKKIVEGEAALQALKQEQGIVNIEERRALLDQKLKEQGSALTSLKTERLEKEALYNQMRNVSNPEELPAVMQNSVVQALRLDLSNLEKQEAQLLEKYLDQHPEVVKVRRQMQETRKRIAAEAQRVIRGAENDYRAALAQEASIQTALDATKAEMADLGQRGSQYDTLKREVDANREVLNTLLSRNKQTEVESELKSSNIRIVDRAIAPGGPIRPNHRQNIMMGLLMGLLLSIGIAFFVEYLDNTVKNPEDVRTYLGTPLLGVIPELSDRPQELVVKPTAQGIFCEGYRLVRTALAYSWPEQAHRVLVVTSTAPGEGKTLTSVNLALTLAGTGARVLLVDCDLRKPQAHNLLRTRRTPGLSDVLVGTTKPSEAIQRLTHISFLSAGAYAPSPGDLLTGQAMRGFVDGLRGHFDWIVIDTPPVGAVAEALILAPASDGVVVVLGAEMISRKAARHTLERVAESGARILGVVLNRAQVEKHSYYYGRYYGHYYGHYYGSYSEAQATSAKIARLNDRRPKRSG